GGAEHLKRPSVGFITGPAPVLQPGDLAAGADDPELALVQGAIVDGGPDRPLYPLAVVGMDETEESGPSYLKRPLGNPEDAVTLGRPANGVGLDVPRPQPGVGRIERQPQPRLALLDRP